MSLDKQRVEDLYQIDRIREIRLSERRFYQKTTGIYALSADYTLNDDMTQQFYARVQKR